GLIFTTQMYQRSNSKKRHQLVVVEGGDSRGNSMSLETPQVAKRTRRLKPCPQESVRLERRPTASPRTPLLSQNKKDDETSKGHRHPYPTHCSTSTKSAKF